jgi:hypothetical protein
MTTLYKEGLPQSGGIAYAVDEPQGTVTFGDELTIRLSKWQRGVAAHLDICRDNNGNLLINPQPSAVTYAAELDIAAKRYDTIVSEADGGETVTLAEIPFALSDVTLTIWGADEPTEYAETEGDANDAEF